MTDYIVQFRVKNGPMLRALRASKYQTVADLSRDSGVSAQSIGRYLNLKAAPLREDGEYRNDILTIAAYLHCSPDDLFPVQHLRKGLATNAAEVEASIEDIAGYLSRGADPQSIAEQREVGRVMAGVLATLPDRPRRAVEMRYGLNGNGEHSLDEVAKEIGGVTRERARQVILRGERLIKHGLAAAGRSKADVRAFD